MMLSIFDQSILTGVGIEAPLSSREWAERYRFVKGGPIADQAADGRVRWSTAVVPHAYGIMDAVDDPALTEVVVEGPTRLAKTEAAIINPMLRELDAGRNVLYINQSREACVGVWQDKIEPAIAATPRLAQFQLGDREGGQMMHRIFRNGAVLYMAGGGQIPTGFDAPKVFCDEINKPGYDRRKGDEVNTLALARERASGYESGTKVVMVCTVTTPDGRITKAYLAGDRRLYYVPCPSCGQYQVMEFSEGHASHADNRRYPDWDYPHGWLEFDDANPVVAQETATYICGLCHERLDEEHKPWMVRNGLWIRKGCQVEVEALKRDRAGAVERPAAKGSGPRRWTAREGGAPETVTTRASFHFNAMVSLITSWGKLASQFVEASKSDDPDELKSVQRSRFSIPYADQDVTDKRSFDAEFVRSHATPYYARTLPDGAPAILATMGADVHAAAIYYVFRAWAADATSWLLEAGVIDVHNMQGADDAAKRQAVTNALDRLWEAFSAGFNVGTEEAPRLLPVELGFLDEGWETETVREACRVAERRGRWYPIKGDDGMERPWRKRLKTHSGSFSLAVDRYKHVVTRLMECTRRTENGQTIADPGYWHLHAEPTHSYVKMVSSEEWRPKKNKTGADVEEYEWGLRSGHNNHLWDCEVYATAAAHAKKIPVHAIGQRTAQRAAPPAPRVGMGEPRRVTREDYGHRPPGGGGWTIGR